MVVRKIGIVMLLMLLLGAGAVAGAAPAAAHVHGITPLHTIATECGVTTEANTGANRAQGEPIHGLIPRDVGQAPLTVGDGGRLAPVGCASN
ncbi:MAG: hypothetical protein ABR548_00220 [Actinomycetota bacterium]|nr:hypothetical protein [Actinomycetota bacterium]